MPLLGATVIAVMLCAYWFMPDAVGEFCLAQFYYVLLISLFIKVVQPPYLSLSFVACSVKGGA